MAVDFAAGMPGVVDIASRWWVYPRLLPRRALWYGRLARTRERAGAAARWWLHVAEY